MMVWVPAQYQTHTDMNASHSNQDEPWGTDGELAQMASGGRGKPQSLGIQAALAQGKRAGTSEHSQSPDQGGMAFIAMLPGEVGSSPVSSGSYV